IPGAARSRTAAPRTRSTRHNGGRDRHTRYSSRCPAGADRGSRIRGCAAPPPGAPSGPPASLGPRARRRSAAPPRADGSGRRSPACSTRAIRSLRAAPEGRAALRASCEASAAQELRDERRDAARDGEHTVGLGHERLIDHPVDLGLRDAYDAVIVARQGTEQPPEAERQRAGDDAERLSARPARVVLVPAAGARPQQPTPERASREAPAGMAAAYRRAEQHDVAARELRRPRERVVHQHAAEAVADKMRSAAVTVLADEARQALDVGVEGRATTVAEHAGA